MRCPPFHNKKERGKKKEKKGKKEQFYFPPFPYPERIFQNKKTHDLSDEIDNVL